MSTDRKRHPDDVPRGLVRAEAVAEALRAQTMVEESRARVRTRLSGARDGLSAVAIGGGYALVAVLFAMLGSRGGLDVRLLAAAIVLYAVAFRIEFEVGPGFAVPTEVVLVPMLFALPLSVVPLGVALGMVLGFGVGRLRSECHPHRIFAQLTSAWHALGPVLVFELVGVPRLELDAAAILALALAAQFAFDLASTIGRNRIGLGVPVRVLVDALRWTFLIDLILALIALSAVAAHSPRVAFVAAIPVLALIAVHAHDRRLQLDRALELSRAYNAATARARSDALTGLGNRLAWEEALAEIELRGERRVGVIVVDLNRLKEANDTRGHAFGDKILSEFARLLLAQTTGAAAVARLGGDEFGALYVGDAAATCRAAAEALKRAIVAHPPIEGFRLAASVGYATCPPCATLAEAVRTADERVYDEKRRDPEARGAAA